MKELVTREITRNIKKAKSKIERMDNKVWDVLENVFFFQAEVGIRSYKVTGVQTCALPILLFFTGAFLERFLSDPLFLYRLPFFHRDRVPELALAPPERKLLARRLREMEAEIGNLRGDSSSLLGARLYEVLMLLARWFERAHPGAMAVPAEGLGLRFRRLVERHHRRTHRVAGYAKMLSVSTGHLNAMVRRQLGRPPLELIQDRLALEARRLLLHTDETAARVGYALGFDDPSYFARFFRRRTGRTPTAFRAGAL